MATASTVGVGFTLIVYVFGVPSQPFAFGVTVIVAMIGSNPLFTAVKPDIFPVPLAASPMIGASFVHSKLVPLTLPDKGIPTLGVALHKVILLNEVVIIGRGFTVIVNCLATPTQPFDFGVTVIVARMGEVVELVVVNESILSVPDKTSPIFVLSQVQSNNEPDTSPAKSICVLASPAQ